MVALHAVPRPAQRQPWVGELLAVTGAGLALLAIRLTGGTDSPYLLMSLAPTLYASARLGTRVGLETALLSVSGLAVIALVLDQAIFGAEVAVIAAVHFVVAATFAQVRRAYRTAIVESEELRKTTAATTVRLERLEAANDLLLRFAGLMDAGELNPVVTGREGLRRLADVVDFEAGLVAVAGEDGPLVVAKTGHETVPHHRTTFSLSARGREVGFVVLARAADFTAADRQVITEALRPIELAFSNILLLRDIVRRAVREERTRLARELHDEIGPSLASLGLALDLAVLEYPADPGLGRHLEELRSSVSTLVDDIRRAVSDLRTGDQFTLTEQARVAAADLPPGGPRVTMHIDERRPPRPAIVEDLMAIVSEALPPQRRRTQRRRHHHRRWLRRPHRRQARRPRRRLRFRLGARRPRPLRDRRHAGAGKPDRRFRAGRVLARSRHGGDRGVGTRVIRVAIADDHRLLLEGLVQALSALPDIEVTGTATDGAQLLALVAADRPDVLLVDLEMPRLDGLAALGQMSNPPPAVVVTMHAGAGPRERAAAAGAVGFLSKSAPLPDLAAAIPSARPRRESASSRNKTTPSWNATGEPRSIPAPRP